MIVIDEKEYRNLQEQVGYLTEQLKQIKQAMGEALPDPIPGPTGATGPQGETGPQGRTPYIGFGYGPLPDTGYENGDIYIARGNGVGVTKGNLYLRVNNTWQLMLNLVGPQGPQGLDGGSQVIANPVEGYSDFLNKIDIDGVIYGIPTGNYVKYISPPESTVLTDEELNNIANGVFINGEYLGFKNPVLFPCGEDNGYYYGVLIGPRVGTYTTKIKNYAIVKATKTIIVDTAYDSIQLENIYQLNGVTIPNYPNSPIRSQILVFGTNNQLSWEKRDELWLHKIHITLTSGDEIWIDIYAGHGDVLSLSELLQYFQNQLTNRPFIYYNSYNDETHIAFCANGWAETNTYIKWEGSANTIDLQETDIDDYSDVRAKLS